MGYLTNSIGAYSFVDLTGSIARRQQQLEIFNRAGIDGSALRKLGSRGKPFVLTSVQFHADFTAALTAFNNYLALPGSAVQAVIRNGINHGNYFVIEVEEHLTEAVINPTGNTSSANTVRQTVRWTLLG